MNSVTLVGRLGQDPEAKVSAQGMTISNMRLAVRRPVKRGDQDTDWFDVVAFGKTAEFANTYLRKGAMIGVSGRIQVNEWQTDAGEKRRNVSIVANDVQNYTPKTEQRDGAAERISEAFGGAEEQRPFDPFAEA